VFVGENITLVFTVHVIMSAPPTNLSPGDYAVFGLTLGISAVVGIFYAIKDRNANEEEYNMGGRCVAKGPTFLVTKTFMKSCNDRGAG